jgi:hypothetical protein
VDDTQLDACGNLAPSLPAGEGEAFVVQLDHRAEIDAELETLLDELSRERLR